MARWPFSHETVILGLSGYSKSGIWFGSGTKGLRYPGRGRDPVMQDEATPHTFRAKLRLRESIQEELKLKCALSSCGMFIGRFVQRKSVATNEFID